MLVYRLVQITNSSVAGLFVAECQRWFQYDYVESYCVGAARAADS